MVAVFAARTALTLFCLLAAPLAAQQAQAPAQAPTPQPAPSPGAAGEVLELWERIAKMNTDMAEQFPADKYDYKPAPEVRSFKEQLLHVASGNYFFIRLAGGEKTRALEGRLSLNASNFSRCLHRRPSAGHDSFLGLQALRCPAAAELGRSAKGKSHGR